MQTIQAPSAKMNDAAKAGQRASKAVIYGDRSRFATYAVHTRFDAVQWFTQDAEQIDEAGLPLVIRQSATFAEALV